MIIIKNYLWIDEKIYTEDSWVMPDFHHHDYYEIYYLFSGERTYLINCDLFDISAGDIVLIKKNDLHMTKQKNRLYGENLKIYLTSEAMNNLGENSQKLLKCFDYNQFSFSVSQKVVIKNVIAEIKETYHSTNPFSNQLVSNLVYKLLAYIYTFSFDEPEMSSLVSDTDNNEINKVIKFIYNNYDKKIYLYDLAKSVNMNPSYFSRFFKKITGLTLTDYINYIRIKNASHFLINTNLPLIEIAYTCGYNDQTHFCRIFKKINGCSPRDFKKQNKLH